MSGAAVARNPALVGGTTAFAVALAFVSANAIWYQPHAHPGAFFATRSQSGVVLPRPADSAGKPHPRETTILIERETTSAVPTGDPTIRQVQQTLRDLGLYTGTVDGLSGPQTIKAVENYQRIVGLSINGRIDTDLLAQLGTASAPVPQPREALVPLPSDPVRPLPRQNDANVPKAELASTGPVPSPVDQRIVRVQAGLKAFGNDGIELDGVVGARTRSAIKEFQTLFGMPVTGEVNDPLLAKMREIGLTN